MTLQAIRLALRSLIDAAFEELEKSGQ